MQNNTLNRTVVSKFERLDYVQNHGKLPDEDRPEIERELQQAFSDAAPMFEAPPVLPQGLKDRLNKNNEGAEMLRPFYPLDSQVFKFRYPKL